MSTVFVLRMGKDLRRFFRNEMYLRPGSPTLTHARNTGQVCPHVCTEWAGPWATFKGFFPAPMLWPVEPGL